MIVMITIGGPLATNNSRDCPENRRLAGNGRTWAGALQCICYRYGFSTEIASMGYKRIAMKNRLGFAFVLLVGFLAVPAIAQSRPATTAPASAPLPPEAIDRLIRDLASPRWTVREAAGNALMDAGTPAYRALRSAFRETSSYEVRKRIKRVAMEIYLAEQLGPPRAFLGIQHRATAGPDAGELVEDDLLGLLHLLFRFQ